MIYKLTKNSAIVNHGGSLVWKKWLTFQNINNNYNGIRSILIAATCSNEQTDWFIGKAKSHNKRWDYPSSHTIKTFNLANRSSNYFLLILTSLILCLSFAVIAAIATLVSWSFHCGTAKKLQNCKHFTIIKKLMNFGNIK